MNHFFAAVASLVILGLTPLSLLQTPAIALTDPIAGAFPIYPPLAVAARIEGTVDVEATVTKGIVTKADAPSTSNAALAVAATNNVRSWRFAPEQSGRFKVQFIFELTKEEGLQPEKPEVQMKLPLWVRIIARPVRPLTIIR